MRESTKALKKEYEQDINKLNAHNNSQIAKRTPEQNEQAFNDKKQTFLNKWTSKLAAAETDAQVAMCEDMLYRIDRMDRRF